MAKSSTKCNRVTVTIGSVVCVPSGTRYKRHGAEYKAVTRTVTVRDIKPDKRSGKTRIFWKSHGYKASALI